MLLSKSIKIQSKFRVRCGEEREWGGDEEGAERVMAVVIVHSKATFVSGGFSFSPLGETGEGFV